MARRAGKRIGKLIVSATAIGIGAMVMRSKLARFAVAESSMQPTLRAGDYVIATPAAELARGDIVIYNDPADTGRDLIKRVIGLPGETVSISRGRVAIDGRQLSEPWRRGPTVPDGVWTNPPGTVFTLGDNRVTSSGDSRASGPVSTIGMLRVFGIYWPPASFGRITKGAAG